MDIAGWFHDFSEKKWLNVLSFLVCCYHSRSKAKGNSSRVNKFLLFSSNSIYNFFFFFSISSAWAYNSVENLWKGSCWNDFTVWEWESYVRSKVKGTFYLFDTVNSDLPGISSSVMLKCTYINFIKYSTCLKTTSEFYIFVSIFL